MLKKTITFEDYNGVSRTKDFYFGINKAELLELQLKTPGGFKEMLQRIIDSKDQTAIVEKFKEIILMSYGEKSDDGMHFRKSKDLTDAFTQTPAYVELYVELATNETAAAEFVNGILPPTNQGVPAPNN